MNSKALLNAFDQLISKYKLDVLCNEKNAYLKCGLIAVTIVLVPYKYECSALQMTSIWHNIEHYSFYMHINEWML